MLRFGDGIERCLGVVSWLPGGHVAGQGEEEYI